MIKFSRPIINNPQDMDSAIKYIRDNYGIDVTGKQYQNVLRTLINQDLA